MMRQGIIILAIATLMLTSCSNLKQKPTVSTKTKTHSSLSNTIQVTTHINDRLHHSKSESMLDELFQKHLKSALAKQGVQVEVKAPYHIEATILDFHVKTDEQAPLPTELRAALTVKYKLTDKSKLLWHKTIKSHAMISIEDQTYQSQALSALILNVMDKNLNKLNGNLPRQLTSSRT